MTIKSKNIIKNLLKVSILSFIIISLLNIWNNFINAKKESEVISEKNNTNNTIYSNSKIDPIANIWVAISTNIWIKYFKKQDISYDNIYQEIYSIDDILNNKEEIKDELIAKNILYIKEYFNFVKTDFNTLLINTNDKKTTLNNIINQLEIRFTNSIKALSLLSKQKEILLDEYSNTINKIESVKKDMEENYDTINLEWLNKNLDEYYDLKRDEAILKTYIILISWFENRYNIINNYNKLLLDTLINNKDIIIKDSYVVIPDSWDQLISDFNLIISETEYKENIKSEE